MSGVQLQVTFEDSAFRGALDALFRAGADLTRPLKDVGSHLVSETTERFRQSKGPDGVAWAAVGRGGKPLVDRGHLRDSITYAVTPSEVQVGSNLIYAAIHQFGGTIHARNKPYLAFSVGRGSDAAHVRVKSVEIPARPFLGLSTDDELEIGEIFMDYLEGAMR